MRSKRVCQRGCVGDWDTEVVQESTGAGLEEQSALVNERWSDARTVFRKKWSILTTFSRWVLSGQQCKNKNNRHGLWPRDPPSFPCFSSWNGTISQVGLLGGIESTGKPSAWSLSRLPVGLTPVSGGSAAGLFLREVCIAGATVGVGLQWGRVGVTSGVGSSHLQVLVEFPGILGALTSHEFGMPME